MIGLQPSLGSGTAVLEHAPIGPCSKLGVGVIVNTAALVEHASLIGDFAHLALRAELFGRVAVGRGKPVGAGAVVPPCIELGEECVIGAGAVVTVKRGATVTGVPAKPVAEGAPS